ncbi:MAG: tRNA uridine-5-carboxymethylaminomethyl(34) synthesis GTPase MnmE [Deltaproteobacteria bacterium]|nr:tRNA uridine-5-carboxymethylaminomethyl(34) synthesis GTPase MnmE [Deltaproteobacteria bacterium]
MLINNTIAAIATASGEAGIGIIRISGPEARNIAENIFRPAKKGPIKERYLYHGRIIEPRNGAVFDDCLFVYMKGPRSFTGEDVVELHCHGGALILNNVLALVLRQGARAAHPGEFTKQAFLNNKLDLAQSEALLDLIRAGTDSALASARSRLGGALSMKVIEIKNILLDLLARIEAGLDFPDDDIEQAPKEKILDTLSHTGNSITALLDTYDHGRLLRDGIKTLILGRPNVGKSSLLNILLKEERAIVAPLPGTTRDIIEEVINIKGLPLRLMDTAGLCETADLVEAIGVTRAKEKIKVADIILFVVDASKDEHNEDLFLLNSLIGKNVIVAANKSDLAAHTQIKRIKNLFRGYTTVFVSALLNIGLEGLEETIAAKSVGMGHDAVHALIASTRHKAVPENALEAIRRASNAIKEELPRELISSEIWWTLSRLGEITGETTSEDVLDRIFSEFCIGK